MIPPKPSSSGFMMLLMSATLLTACYQTMDVQCHYSSDCEPTSYCRAGQCIPASNPHKGQAKKSYQVPDYPDAFGDHTINDTTSLSEPPCPTGQRPNPGDIVINEFLVNVPPGPAGDANGDGIRHPHDDEFVELVNISDHQLDLTGLKIQNATATKYTFPRFCLNPRHAAVVFGGFEYNGPLPSGPGFHAMIAQSRFMFNNDQGTIVIRAHDNQELVRVNYERSPPQALTLSPELYGTRYMPHNSHAPDTLFSPGTCANSRPLTSGCSTDDQDAGYSDSSD